MIGISYKIPTNPSNFKVSNISKLIQDHRLDITDTNKLGELISKCSAD